MTKARFLAADLVRWDAVPTASGAIGSGIRRIVARCGIGFGLTHLAFVTIIGRMRPSPEFC